MKFWKRRKPIDLVESQLQAVAQWDGPSEVIHDLAMAKIMEEMNRNIQPKRIPLRDKIKMTSIRG